MGTYSVYNENYTGYGVQDLESVDFVEVTNAVINAQNLYSPSIKKLLNIVNVKVQDIPAFTKRNKILTPLQVLQLNGNCKTDEYTPMQPYQYKHQLMKEEVEADQELTQYDAQHKDDDMFTNDAMMSLMRNYQSFIEDRTQIKDVKDDADDFFSMLTEAEKYCPTAVNANRKYEEEIKKARKDVPKYEGFTGKTADRTQFWQPEQTPEIHRTCGYLEGKNMIDRETLDTPIRNDYCTSGIALAPSTFDDTPIKDFNIDVDSIFTSQPKNENTIDVTDLDKISSDNSSLLQGSCLDMFNDTVDKFGDAKFREPAHTSPAKLEKQRRIEEYHKRHNRKRDR